VQVVQRSTWLFFLTSFFSLCATAPLLAQPLCFKQSFVHPPSLPVFSSAYGLSSFSSYSFDAAYFQLDSASVLLDSTRGNVLSDSLSTARDTTLKYRLDPGIVALGAAVLPGFGQIYNRSYWKLPIVYGIIGWFAYNYIRQNNEYLRWQGLYNDSLAAAQARGVTPAPETTAYRAFRESARESRDEYGVYILLAYLLSIVDAYIDAHLFGFDVSDDLTSRAAPASGVPVLSIKLKF
jgi:hypothetical protein